EAWQVLGQPRLQGHGVEGVLVGNRARAGELAVVAHLRVLTETEREVPAAHEQTTAAGTVAIPEGRSAPCLRIGQRHASRAAGAQSKPLFPVPQACRKRAEPPDGGGESL